MPKRSRSGVVSRPARVVAPTSVNGGRSSVTTCAPAPWPIGDRQPAGPPSPDRRSPRARALQAVDLVDEEHAARLERGEQRGDVALALERRAGGLHERHAELVGDDLRQRRLAQAGRAGEQHVVERLAARDGRLDGDRELLAQRRPGRRTPRARAGRSERSSSSSPSSTPGVWMRGGSVTRGPPCSALGDAAPRRSRRRRRRAAPAASAGAKPSSSRPSRASARGSSPPRRR